MIKNFINKIFKIKNKVIKEDKIIRVFYSKDELIEYNEEIMGDKEK